MDALGLARGFLAGLAAAGVVTAVQALAWARWGRSSVFEWQEAEAGMERLLGRRSMVAGLAGHVLAGGVAGVVFVLGVAVLPIAGPRIALGAGMGFLMWLITLVIHEPVTGSPAKGVGVAVTLVTHLIYGTLVGAWA
ncbi:MAG TPA: hypothetical protein VGR51_08220 [Thermoplasmata archaeon]|jgi:hypothetical protein|nr:hypothetical protein [Thermoplasmata archaeon]